jgi:glycosyltransferase involved in cell wall biosynthesis
MKRPRPSLAVIMPVLNAAPFLAPAIDSVLSELPPAADLVVVDGGSTDDRTAIAAGFARVRVLMQSGRGLAAARNQGLRAVDADFIGFCDSDDRWAEGALAVRLAHLQSRPDCDAVIGGVVGEAVAGESVTPQQAARLGRPLPGFTPGALLARRHVFQKIGLFDETLTIGTDSDWFVRLQQSRLRLAVLPTVVLFKGARATSLSTDRETYRRELLRVAREFVERRRTGRQ